MKETKATLRELKGEESGSFYWMGAVQQNLLGHKDETLRLEGRVRSIGVALIHKSTLNLQYQLALYII